MIFWLKYHPYSWLLNMRRRILWFVAFRLLPPALVYFVAIRVWAHATTGPYGNEEAPAATMDKAIKRWSRDHRLAPLS